MCHIHVTSSGAGVRGGGVNPAFGIWTLILGSGLCICDAALSLALVFPLTTDHPTLDWVVIEKKIVLDYKS